MSDLTDYGAGTTVEPPVVRRRMILQSPHTGKIAGFIGRERHRGVKVYTSLRRGPHFYHSKQAYAISDTILGELTDRGVVRIYFHEGTEEDTEDVYEFTTRQYVEGGKPVPESHLHDEVWDPQTYVPLADHHHYWPNHSGDLFVLSFSRAVESMNPPWRGYDPDMKERIQQRNA